MRFSRQKYWSSLPCLPPGSLLDSGIRSESAASPSLAGEFFTTSMPGKPVYIFKFLEVKNIMSKGQFLQIVVYTGESTRWNLIGIPTRLCKKPQQVEKSYHWKILNNFRWCYSASVVWLLQVHVLKLTWTYLRRVWIREGKYGFLQCLGMLHTLSSR